MHLDGRVDGVFISISILSSACNLFFWICVFDFVFDMILQFQQFFDFQLFTFYIYFYNFQRFNFSN